MEKKKPRVSIGLPVRNGEAYLEGALESLLSQTYEDFEIIISDNGSSDRTQEICRASADRDTRIRYYRIETNLGAAWNFNRVFELSSGEYFKWAAHDDILAPDFLERCVRVLDLNPDVVLCHSRVALIDEEGNFLQNYEIKLNTISQKPHERFFELLYPHLCYQIFGVIRARTLRMTPLIGGYANSDGVLLSRLGLHGQMHEIPEYLFFSRKHPRQSMSRFVPDYLYYTKKIKKLSGSQLPDYYRYTVWFNPDQKGKIIFPHWRIFREYVLAVHQAPLERIEQLRCYYSMWKQLRGMEYLLIKDLFAALRTTLDRCKNAVGFSTESEEKSAVKS